MIYLLYGENSQASYMRLSQISSSVAKDQLVNLDKEHTLEDFYLSVYGDNLFSKIKVIICRNFLSDGKITAKHLDKFPENKTLVLHEEGKLTEKIISGIREFVRIEYFKPQSQIFWFLDSLSPQMKVSLKKFIELDFPRETSVFVLTHRVFLLICVKIGLDRETASKIVDKKLASWQWEILKRQARLFTLEQLTPLYKALVRLDLAIKKGVTSLSQEALVPIVLLKYLAK